MKQLHRNRKAVAAVEAAVCLPVLLVVWFGSFEMSRLLSLKQQAQLLSSNAAHQVISTTDSLEEIELEIEDLATSLGIVGCEATLTRVDSEVVQSTVSIDFSRNSPLSSLLTGRNVNSTFHSYREN